MNNTNTTIQRNVPLLKKQSSLSNPLKKYLASMCNEPQVLVEELIRQKARLQEILLYTIVLGSPCKYADTSCHPHFSIRTFLNSSQSKRA